MRQALYAHNISLDDIPDSNYHALYSTKRRDANFAAAVPVGDKIHALRDHLGVAPLYFRYTDDGVKFSHHLSNLVHPADSLNIAGLRALLQLGSPRLLPLFDAIHIVPPATVIEIDPARRSAKPVYSYALQPRRIPLRRRWQELIDEFETLMTRAIQQCLRSDDVGLYLSGGIDSAMIGIILKKLGVAVRAYTSGPWGESSSDVAFAKRNAALIGLDHHEIHYLGTDDYESAMTALPASYGIPHGNPTALGIIKLREQSSAPQQAQLFFGHNADNMLAAMRAQYLCYFLAPLPLSMRRRLHPALTRPAASENLLSLRRNYRGPIDALILPKFAPGLSALQEVTATGMLTAHFDVFNQPSFMQNQSIVSPYHHMDVVEFAMGLPLARRLALAANKLPILEKRLIQKLAIRALPRDIVYRKKAFVVSFERDKSSQALYGKLPTEICGITLRQPHERFAAEMLLRWLEHCGCSTCDLRGK